MLGPIFNREWLTVPRRSRHYLERGFYLGALWILLLTMWQTVVGWEQTATRGDYARFGLLAFHALAVIQLTLLLFFAALAAASAITTEKDRRTFVLLLLTDLRDREIVLGKLGGSLLQIGLFLLGSAPVFALLMFLGGVDGSQVIDVLLILATMALAAGSLGTLVALWRDKTFQALALTVLFVVLYFCVVHGLSLMPLVVDIDPDLVARWQDRLEPFLALQRVIDPPARATWLAPAHEFGVVMSGVALLLNVAAMVGLRRWNPSGEPVIRPEQEGEAAEEVDRAKAHAAPGRLRPVTGNPILWRETRTRAYGRRPLLVKLAYFLVVGLIGYYALFLMEPRAWAAGYGLVPIAVLSLLLLAAQAVTAITSERDLGALDLLMVTDLSPREFIFGKLLGILWNAKEFIVPPLLLVAVYAWRGQLAAVPRGQPELLAGRNVESAVCIALGVVILMAFTTVLGVHVALRNERSRFAIVNTLGTVFFLSIGTLVCIYLILISGRFEYQWFSFLGFVVAGVGGLWWVLSADRPSTALALASWACPVAVFYTVTNILIGRPGTLESSDPLIPFLVTGGAFGFALAAMIVPLLSEFDVAIGRTSAIGE